MTKKLLCAFMLSLLSASNAAFATEVSGYVTSMQLFNTNDLLVVLNGNGGEPYILDAPAADNYLQKMKFENARELLSTASTWREVTLTIIGCGEYCWRITDVRVSGD